MASPFRRSVEGAEHPDTLVQWQRKIEVVFRLMVVAGVVLVLSAALAAWALFSLYNRQISQRRDNYVIACENTNREHRVNQMVLKSGEQNLNALVEQGTITPAQRDSYREQTRRNVAAYPITPDCRARAEALIK